MAEVTRALKFNERELEAIKVFKNLLTQVRNENPLDPISGLQSSLDKAIQDLRDLNIEPDWGNGKSATVTTMGITQNIY